MGAVPPQHLPHDTQQALPIFWSSHKAALQEMSSVRTCTRLISSKSSWGCRYLGIAYNESIISFSRCKGNLWSPLFWKYGVTKRRCSNCSKASHHHQLEAKFPELRKPFVPFHRHWWQHCNWSHLLCQALSCRYGTHICFNCWVVVKS